MTECARAMPMLPFANETLAVAFRKLAHEVCRRFDQLDDGDWEELFDDRQALRSDMMDGTWVEFARKYSTLLTGRIRSLPILRRARPCRPTTLCAAPRRCPMRPANRRVARVVCTFT